jgi:hypothetical protein
MTLFGAGPEVSAGLMIARNNLTELFVGFEVFDVV